MRKPTIKIGLIGEDSNDTDAIIHLMKQKYDVGYRYRTLSLYKKGTQIFNESAAKSFNFEIKKDPPHYVIVVADADAIITETDKIRNKKVLYERLAKWLDCKSLLLLNIYELEALIFADIDTFNSHYNVSVKGDRDVMYINEPKEELMRKTSKTKKKYSESHCPDLFTSLRIETVSKNCSYFKIFLDEFSAALI